MEGADALTLISEEPADRGAPTPTKVSGQRVGRYHLAFEVASGGMATVYLAAVRGPGGFDKVFALKRIHTHLAKERNYVEMFLDEARLAARIQHPNVCGVFDFGEHDGEYFLAMEYMLGVPLSRVLTMLSKTGMPPERWAAVASRLVEDACEGLHAAHELRAPDGSSLGVVHRDVSPQNLFVGFDGVLKVVDFGIAKAADKASVTRTLELKGKVAYMAPEQIRKGEVDRRADVFALGVVTWEMLTLRRLFRRSSQVDTMYAVLESPILVPSEFAEVPRALDEVVMRALSREADERTPDARTFGREISRVWGRELDQPVDRAEIAQIMAELFPGEEQAQRDLVEAAKREEDPPERHSVPHDDQSFSDGTVLARPRKPKRASRRRYLAPALAFSILALGGVGGAWLAMSEDDGGAARPRVLAVAVEEAVETETTSTAAPVPEHPPTEVAEDDAPGDGAEAEHGVAAAERRSRVVRPAMTAIVMTNAMDAPAVPTATEEAPPVAEGPGTLIVVVPGGWANVYDAESGRLLGATPLTKRLPAGSHSLELRFGGQPPPIPVAVEITSGETTRLTRRPP